MIPHELEIRQNELYLAMCEVEGMPASEAQTACVTKLAGRMRLLVELNGKSEVGRLLIPDAVSFKADPLSDPRSRQGASADPAVATGIRGIGRNAYGPIQQYENEMGQTITLIAWPDKTCREGYSMFSLAQAKDLIARLDPGGFMGRNLGVEVDTETCDLVLS